MYDYENMKKLAIIGRITSKTAMSLKNDTGIDFENCSLAFNKSYLKHIEREHILNANYKIKKGKNKSLPTAHDSNNPVIARPKRSGVSSSSSNNIPKFSGNMQEK